ncbi:unnamed protein product [Rotaria sp. Silwood2]|nr:unnamed protein product [Rotaria sp. Silwood2]CAF2789199.1 unnamed protein product [Rotaria sp. Silwood2]CAF3055321.1 unnamed protein product [Rotaria sp. Silwood2]CAF3231258.1 unnamed protein product [Rotaria sp. Silwood2]CAF4328322.1 unnamed protein product [Rotaria sp. Silwood2]
MIVLYFFASAPSKPSSSSLLIILIVIIAMIGLFTSIIGFLIYQYHKNQRRYLKTLTRTIYDTLQNSSFNSTIPTSIAQELDRSSILDAHHSQYAVAYLYK